MAVFIFQASSENLPRVFQACYNWIFPRALTLTIKNNSFARARLANFPPSLNGSIPLPKSTAKLVLLQTSYSTYLPLKIYYLQKVITF